MSIQSFSSVKMRGVSPSVESVIMLVVCQTFFFERIIQIFAEAWWRNACVTSGSLNWCETDLNENNQDSFQGRKGKRVRSCGRREQIARQICPKRRNDRNVIYLSMKFKRISSWSISFRGYQSFNWKTRKQKQIEFLLWRLRAKQREQLVFLHNCNIWLILPVLYASVKD